MKPIHAQSTDQYKLDGATWLCLLKPRWEHWDAAHKPPAVLTIGPISVTISRSQSATLLCQKRKLRTS